MLFEKGATMKVDLPPTWHDILASELEQPYFARLSAFVDEERAAHQVFPPEGDVFNAFKLTPHDRIKVLIVGQDPYHDDGQAHGLAFSVRPGIKTPPSLVNIYKELKNDLGCRIPNNGFLVPWAEQGVMLLNTALTVRAHQANSHKGKGWERFTDAVIKAVSDTRDHVVFVLWGGNAQKKQALIDEHKHTIVQSAHPSPLSARNGFFGSKAFSRINADLQQHGIEPIDWQIPDL